jgi:hypothetical protein
VANALAALGASPRIRSIPTVGTASQGLPGGVATDLRPVLSSLSRHSLRTFMRLEASDELLAARERDQLYPTIGSFYRAIQYAVQRNARAVREAVREGGPANQVGGNIGFETVLPTPGVDPVDQIIDGIDGVLDQGEGIGGGSISAGEEFQNEGSHYARFAELWHGARYREPDPPMAFTLETQDRFFTGEPIGWPEVINTLMVPEDGYRAVLDLDPEAADARKDLEAFDAAYTAMMIAMDDMWNGPPERSWPSFGAAVAQMNELRVICCFGVNRHRVPDDVVAQLKKLYPREFATMARYTDLARPVFYGPRFINNA